MTRRTTPSRPGAGGVLHVSGSASVVLGATLLVAALLDCTDGADVAARLAGIGAAATVVGLGLRRRAEVPTVVGPATVLASMLAVFSVAVAWSVVVYVITETIVKPR